MYKEHVTELQGMPLKERKIKVFFSGDYEYLCRMYGLSGASGRHRCLWCTIPSSKLKIPLAQRGRFPLRSLETLESDYSKFVSTGSDLRRAKECNNVIGEYIFDIPLENVCIPGLHLSLGIYNRLWSLLVDACNKLDLKLADGGGRAGGASFIQYSSLLTQRSQLNTRLITQESQATMLEQLTTFMALSLPDPESNPTLSAFRHEASVARQLADSMSSELSSLDDQIKRKFSPKDGPFYQSLEKSLSDLNVVRQAYHGGSFVGNHVHKLLKSSSIKALCQNLVSVASSPTLKQEAEDVSETFSQAFELFAKCHKGYNANVVTDSAIEQTEQDIAIFLEYYRRTFPDATILPKMHIMEDHIIPWLKRWHTGAGLMGEQGAESIHAHFMKLETRYQTIANPVDRLKYIFTQQILE